MAKEKTKKRRVVVCKLPHFGGGKECYKVIRLVNCLEPIVGEVLTETEVQHLIDSDPDCTVEVNAWK